MFDKKKSLMADMEPHLDELSIDKELDTFFKKTNTNKLLSNNLDGKPKFTRLDSKVQKDIHETTNNEIIKSKKPVVVIKSLPKDDEPIEKKPVVIIKKNISKLYAEDIPTKKPVVTIVRNKRNDANIVVDDNIGIANKLQKPTVVTKIPKKTHSLNIDFDAPPTEEQINRSSVKIKPMSALSNNLNNIQENNVKQQSQIQSTTIESDYKKDYPKNKFDWTQKSSLDDVDAFKKLNYVESLDDIVENNDDSSVDEYAKLQKGTQFDKLHKKYYFESLILDSIHKKITTTSFRSNIIKKLNMTINANDLVVVYGNEHSGKSTLLNIIARTETFNKGEYIVMDKIHGDLEEHQIDNFINENLFFIYKDLIIDAENNIFYYLNFMYEKASYEFKNNFSFEFIINKFNIEHILNKSFNEITPLQQQIVLIVFAILKEVSIILIDEPIIPIMNEDDYIIKNVLRIANAYFMKTIVITTSNKSLFDIATKIYYLIKGTAKLV